MAKDDRGSSLYTTGLTEEEANEVHGWMVFSTIVYILFAVAAHSAMWFYKPWLGG